MSVKSVFRGNGLARSIRDIFHSIGSQSDSPFKSIVKTLGKSNVSAVLDIGANLGQFGLDIRRHGFQGQIISFEPVDSTYKLLSQTVKNHQPWKAIQLGLGAIESERVINVSGNAGLSSSILNMKLLHLEHFPESATVAQQKISISTIDNQLEVFRLRPQDVMIKLDVQGFEAEVLKGASKSLSKIPLCYLEVSLIPLYEGELSLLPILKQLDEFGHEVIDLFRGTKSRSGQLLQVDILTRLSN